MYMFFFQLLKMLYDSCRSQFHILCRRAWLYMYNCIHVYQRELAFCKLSCHHWKIRHGWNMYICPAAKWKPFHGGPCSQQQILASQCFSKSLIFHDFVPSGRHLFPSSSPRNSMESLQNHEETSLISAATEAEEVWGGKGPWVTNPRCIGSISCQGLNSHYFHIIGDGHHQPNSRGPIYQLQYFWIS